MSLSAAIRPAPAGRARWRARARAAPQRRAVIAHGQAVTLLPELVAPEMHPGVVVRAIAEGSVHRTIFAATRTTDSARPSVQALLAAVRRAAAQLGWPAPVGSGADG